MSRRAEVDPFHAVVVAIIALALVIALIITYAGLSGLFTQRKIMPVQQTLGDPTNGTIYLYYDNNSSGAFGYPEHFYPINNQTIPMFQNNSSVLIVAENASAREVDWRVNETNTFDPVMWWLIYYVVILQPMYFYPCSPLSPYEGGGTWDEPSDYTGGEIDDGQDEGGVDVNSDGGIDTGGDSGGGWDGGGDGGDGGDAGGDGGGDAGGGGGGE